MSGICWMGKTVCLGVMKHGDKWSVGERSVGKIWNLRIHKLDGICGKPSCGEQNVTNAILVVWLWNDF